MNKRTLHKLGLTLWLATAVVMPNVSSADPGTLASVPLFTQANAEPNILLHLDSSGSMQHVLAESPYDSSVTYDADEDTAGTNTCTSPLAAGSTVTLQLTGSPATPYIRYNSTNYNLGNDSGEVCFDPSANYYATLTTASGTGVDIVYSGNYLNWYFNSTTTSGTWGSIKPETRTRMEAAQTSLTYLVNSLNNVRLGFSKFSGSNGADITQDVDTLTTTHRTNIKTAISGTSASGYTPLAESLRDIGRYFSNDGSGNCGGGNDLTLHPDTSPTAATCSTVLDNRSTGGGPVTEFCQSNFAIFTTDGLATQDRSIDSSISDYDDDCTTIPDVDPADGNPDYTCNSYDMKDNQTYEDSSRNPSDYFDDVAAALYDIDLRPDLDDNDGNDYKNNLRTFVIGFADETVRNNQMLLDAASQGGGEFIFAEDTDNLTTALENATSSILNLIGSAAAVTFNSATLGTDSAVYLALFNSSSWSGDLTAYDLNDTTGIIESQTWSAADNLDALGNSSAVSNRVMLTYNGSQGVAFRWPTDYQSPTSTEMSTAQLQDLLTNADYAFGTSTASEISANDTFGQDLVDYLRGDTTLENTTFRNRTSRLGDIVHAGPVYVGPPELNWPDGGAFPDNNQAYSYYKLNSSTDTPAGRADRPGVVYVGSNDGFLHGFATEDNASEGWSAGDEVLAYAPKALFSTDNYRGFHYLADTGYNHQYYVDLQPTISDIFDPDAGTSGEWKTVLVGGLRGGGRAIYALDVTDPTGFSESTTDAANTVLWEFTHSDDNDLGYTFSQPTIGLMENGRWAVIMGNGYLPDSETCGSNDCEAILYVIYLDADPSDGWDEGTTNNDDYVKITTGYGNTDFGSHNGLSSPTAVDITGDGRIDRVYAGDLAGNMWAFDLDGNAGSWDVAYSSGNGAGATPEPLFTATTYNAANSSDGVVQPITVQPEVVYNTAGNNSTDTPNTLVLFGTGQYMASGDNSNLGDQAFYAVWDHGDHSQVPSDLVEQELSESSGQRTISNNATIDWTTNDGWFINFDLNNDGERMVTNPVIRGDYVYFNTSIPTDTTCSYGGTGWQMAVQYADGHNPSSAITDTNGDNTVNGDDTALSGEEFEQGLPAAPNFLSNRRYTPGTRTQTGEEVVDDAVEAISGSGTGRLSWEELSQ